MRSPLLKRAITCLFVGVLITLAVAWGMAFIHVPGARGVATFGSEDRDRWLVHFNERIGATHMTAVRLRASDRVRDLPNSGNKIVTFDPPGILVIFDVRNPHPSASSPPAWSELARRREDVGAVSMIATGWPARCLKAEAAGPHAAYANASLATMHGGVRYREARPPANPGLMPRGAGINIGIDGLGESVLPFIPIWAGLIADSLFYEVLLFVTLWLLLDARRWHRRRRGLCLACGYDLRHDFGSGCSECGWNRPETGQTPARIQS